jgi:ABC-type phosphate transport system permease subunit
LIRKKKDCEKDIGRVEMMEGESSKTKRAVFNDRGYLDVVLSWSLEDISDENLYKNQVCFNPTLILFLLLVFCLLLSHYILSQFFE